MPETRRAMAALFLLALGVLVLQVTLTRVFSVMSWHHFAYLIISLALMGFGAASALLTVSPRFAAGGFDARLLARYALGFWLATLLGYATATKVHFYPIDVYRYGDFSNFYSLALLYLIVGSPFYFAGVCIAYLMSRAGDRVHRFYFSDLLGAGTGALLAVYGINRLGVEATIYAVSATGAATALLFGWRLRGLRLLSTGALAVSCLMTALAAQHQIFPVYFPPDKIFRLAMEPHYFRWHVIARVDVLEARRELWDFGGALSESWVPGPGDSDPEVRGVYQDGGAATGILSVPGGDVQKLAFLGSYPQGAPYVLGAAKDRALVIGVGGGIDVLIALYNGMRHVVGVEVNPVVVDALKNRFADFTGRVFHRPDVELLTAEGRHYLTTTKTRFDVIQLSGVDTYSALASGAYALAENYLYTTDAMLDYWAHLGDDGILSFSRWLFTPPRETLRLVTVQMEALRRLGVTNPERHLMVIRGEEKTGYVWAEALLKKSEFSAADIAAYYEWAERMQFEILYDPDHRRDNAFDRIIRASVAERAAFIREYLYNIEPISDDSPFFFDFYKWRSLLNPQASAGKGGYYITRFPLGLAILLFSLVQILVLSFAFVIAPLARRGTAVRAVPHKRPLLLFFAALGFGFIMVEIVLLQKFTVFVGGPVYAMSVTLFSILIFSGLGSLLAPRWNRNLPRFLSYVILALCAGVIAELVFVNEALPRLLFLPHFWRCALAVLAVAPLALLMGMPFPTGLRLAQRVGAPIVPWAWGVNAVATTIGAVAGVLFSMEWGFTWALVSAAVCYLAGLVAIRPVARRFGRTPASRAPDLSATEVGSAPA